MPEGEWNWFGYLPEFPKVCNESGGEYYYYYVFFDTKRYCSVTPPHSWTIQHCEGPDCGPPDLKAEVAAQGPLVPLPFLDGFTFERNYIGAELKEIQERKIEAPRYGIKMNLGPP